MKKLDIFDFDGTLFRSPVDNEENRNFYEKETGIPWVISKEQSKKLSEKHGKKIRARNGWFGREETLLPPLVPLPAPDEMWIEETVQEFLESKSCTETVTIMMTGRHAGIQGCVLRLLSEKGLVKTVVRGDKYFHADEEVNCLFRDQNGPAVKAPSQPTDSTISWKLWIIEKYITLFPELEAIKVWEDREPHVQSFQEFGKYVEQSFDVKHVLG